MTMDSYLNSDNERVYVNADGSETTTPPEASGDALLAHYAGYVSPLLFIPLTTTKGETFYLRASTIQGVDPFVFPEDHLDTPGHAGSVMSFILNGEVKVTAAKETPDQVAALLNGG